ncbi:ATP-binding protein [Ignavibacteriales bacterium]
MKKITGSLSFKLVFITSAVLVVMLVTQTLLTTAKLREDMIESLSTNAYNLSELIKNSTRYSMILNSKEHVNEIFKNLEKKDGILSIKLYDKEGFVRFSGDKKYLKQSVSIKSDICSPCHSSNQRPLEKLSLIDRRRIVNDGTNKYMLLLNPIENEKDCSTSGCHSDEHSSKILGILEVKMSLENIDDIVEANIETVITNSLVGMAIISLLTGLLVTFLVIRPIKKITKGIGQIAGGNLNYKIELESNDEFGEMASQFNEMSMKLDSAYKEIKEWNDTLNTKIEEKTDELKNVYAGIIQVEKLASLGKLSATVAHELNNPLAGILNYARLIIKKLNKQQKEDEFQDIIKFLTLIAEESERCGGIVKDLLLFSHRGDEQYLYSNLAEIISRSEMLINHHLEINQIKLVKEIPTEPVIVNGNPQKIQQVILSLLINAIEAMSGGRTITVKVDDAGELINIRIIDQGCGIAEKDLPHIFEPFYSTKEAVRGTGLGLSVVYGIIHAHEGNVEVEKTSNRGTTILITLPRVK